MPFVVSLTIRTSNPDGLLLSAADSQGEKYVALYIRYGRVSNSLSDCLCEVELQHAALQVFFAASRGSGANAQLVDDRVICDNKWYQVNATVDNNKLVLSVGGDPAIETAFSEGSAPLTSSATIYIGGLPGGYCAHLIREAERY